MAPLEKLRGGDDGGADDLSSSTDMELIDRNNINDEKQNSEPIAITRNSQNTVGKVSQNTYEYSNLRNAIFPIYGKFEITKFLLMSTMNFSIILALVLTRDTKDTLVVTQCGAEAIAFLKIYGVLPATTAFIALYSKMSSILDKKHLFYATCIPFFVFFALFDTFIYPNADKIQPSLSLATNLVGGSTTGAGPIISKILSHWTSALFYIVSEIYSSVSIGLLFWQFANDVVSISQAQRFYPLFAQMSGLAPICAGQYVVRFASKAADFDGSMHRLTAAILSAGCMICIMYHFVNSFLEHHGEGLYGGATTAPGSTTEINLRKKKKKPEMTMMDSYRFLSSSTYLRLLFSLVIGYSISIQFTEVIWKSLLKKQYPNPLDYQRFMGNFATAVGICTSLVIFAGVHIIRIMGWKVGAITTPIIMGLLAIPFFGCIFMGLDDSPERLSLAIAVGTIQSIIAKASKYALFDPTTQMAYIPLDEDSKMKGKAAIDVLGSRLGKSGGSLIQQILVQCFGNILHASLVIVILLYTVLITWVNSAVSLSKLFMEKNAVMLQQAAAEKKQL